MVLIVSFFALSALWKQPRFEQEDWRPLGERLSRALINPVDRGRRRAGRRLPARAGDLGGPPRHRGAGSQLRAHLHLRHLLARLSAVQRPPRGRLSALQPLAGDRPRGRRPLQGADRAATRPPALPGAAGALAGGAGAGRVRLAGADLRSGGHDRADAPHHRRRGAPLQRLHPGDDGRCSAPRNGCGAARPSRSTSTCSRSSSVFEARDGRIGRRRLFSGAAQLGDRPRLARSRRRLDRDHQLRRSPGGCAGGLDQQHLRQARRRRLRSHRRPSPHRQHLPGAVPGRSGGAVSDRRAGDAHGPQRPFGGTAAVGLRPHPDPDRVRIPGRPLLQPRRLPGAGAVHLSAVGPAGNRSRHLRHRGQRNRLRRWSARRRSGTCRSRRW